MSPALRTLATLAASVALLAAAGIATTTAPDDDALQVPFELRGGIGTTVTSRTTVVQVHGVRAARRLDFGVDGPDGRSDGVWLVVDLTVGCRLRGCSFGDSLLRIGPRTYRPAVLAPVPSFASLPAEPGLLYRTDALFELPRSALTAARTGDLVVQPAITDGLDSVAVVTLPLPRATTAALSVGRARVVGAAR